MPITPADVRALQFRVVFRGYEISAVDTFLDAIETELGQLMAGADVTGSSGAALASSAGAGAADGAAGHPDAPGGVTAGRHATRSTADDLPGPATRGWDGRADDPAVGATTDDDEAGLDVPARAVRTLRLAEQMADQVVAGAVAEADQVQARAADDAARLRDEAQAQADRVLAEAHAEAHHIVVAARVEAGEIHAQVEALRDRQVEVLARRSHDLRAEVERLAELERTGRERLEGFLHEQLRLLGPGVGADDRSPADEPSAQPA